MDSESVKMGKIGLQNCFCHSYFENGYQTCFLFISNIIHISTGFCMCVNVSITKYLYSECFFIVHKDLIRDTGKDNNWQGVSSFNVIKW